MVTFVLFILIQLIISICSSILNIIVRTGEFGKLSIIKKKIVTQKREAETYVRT